MAATPQSRAHIVGIDVGGTFTDLVLFDASTGTLSVAKVPSTTANQAVGVMAAIHSVEPDLTRLERLAHGTTVSTNALLEHAGARVALITTKGFRDTIEIGRTRRMLPSLYDPTFVRPPPLVPRPLRFEVAERLAADGSVIVPLDAAELDAAIDAIKAQDGVAAIAICFLHAYANPKHECLAAARVQRAVSGIKVTTSAEVVPEFREYERFSTTVINASLMPVMGRYISALDAALTEAGCGRRLFTMSSSGGTMDSELACRLPVRTILSGPAGGVAGSLWVANAIGLQNFITCDMGGTSTDVCLVDAGQPDTVTEVAFAGYPIKGHQISINTVGAGGGSLAYPEAGNILRVGPRSAGAQPGPACYGHGGVEPTVTDANVALNRMGTTRRLGGHIEIHRERAVRAIGALAERVGSADISHLAEGIIKIAVARMASAIREITIEKGHNPSDFALMAFGGAGPMHAAALAEELGIREVVIPLHPGNLSALGLIVSDQRYDLVRTFLRTLSKLEASEIETALDTAEREAAALLAARGFTSDNNRFEHTLDMRYVRQAFEITVALPGRPVSREQLRASFLATYERHYGHTDTASEIEIVNLRTTAVGLTAKPTMAILDEANGSLSEACLGSANMIVGGSSVKTALYDREKLPCGESVSGACIIEEPGATTVLLPGWTCQRDTYGNLRLNML
jgi:N-methylhydantoinase A